MKICTIGTTKSESYLYDSVQYISDVDHVTSAIVSVSNTTSLTPNKTKNHHPTANSHSLDDFISMTPDKGPGTVYSLQEFVYVFYKLPNTQLAQSNNENNA